MNKSLLSEKEYENIKSLLERKSKEVEIIKQISNKINKSLDLNLIAWKANIFTLTSSLILGE